MLCVNRKLVMGHNVWLTWLMPEETASNQSETSAFFPRYTLTNGRCICQLLSGLACKVTFRGSFFAAYHLIVRPPQRLPLSPTWSQCHGQRRRHRPTGCGPQESGCDLGPASLPPCLILCAVMPWLKVAMRVALFKSTDRTDNAAF